MRSRDRAERSGDHDARGSRHDSHDSIQASDLMMPWIHCMGHAWIAIPDHVLVFSTSTEVADLAGAEKGGCGLASPIQACATASEVMIDAIDIL